MNGGPYPYKEQARYDKALRGDSELPEKPKYRRWRQLKQFAAHPSRYSFLLGVTMGLFHSVPRQDPPKAFSELLRRDILFYKTYSDQHGELRLGLSPTLGYSRGSAIVFALTSKQIEEFHSPWHRESHDQARDRLFGELSAAGYSVRREAELKYTRQRRKKRVKMKARWDLHMPGENMVLEIESGLNKSSQVQRHIESCLAKKQDLVLYIPRITSQEPQPEEPTEDDTEDLLRIVKAEEELEKVRRDPLRRGMPAEDEAKRGLLYAKARADRRFLRERTRAGKVWPLEISGAEREIAARYTNHLTQVLWRCLLSARRLPNMSVDFCYDDELLRSVRIERGKIYLDYDQAIVQQPLVKTGDHPVQVIEDGKSVEKESEHYFMPGSLQILVDVDGKLRTY